MNDEIIYMIAGQDEHGDHHMVRTDNLERVIAHYHMMSETLINLRGNEAFEIIIRPLIEALPN